MGNLEVRSVSGRGLKIQIMSNSRGPKLEKANQVFCLLGFFCYVDLCLFVWGFFGWLVGFFGCW